MIIKYEGQEYKCHWKQWGFSYARPVAKRRVPFLFGWLERWKPIANLAVGKQYLLSEIDRMLPIEARTALRDALIEKLKYEEAWQRDRFYNDD